MDWRRFGPTLVGNIVMPTSLSSSSMQTLVGIAKRLSWRVDYRVLLFCCIQVERGNCSRLLSWNERDLNT